MSDISEITPDARWPQMDRAAEGREWFIRKSGYLYRPDRKGYTTCPIAAGLYTQAEAEAEERVEPATITAVHASEYAAEIVRLRDAVRRFDFIADAG